MNTRFLWSFILFVRGLHDEAIEERPLGFFVGIIFDLDTVFKLFELFFYDKFFWYFQLDHSFLVKIDGKVLVSGGNKLIPFFNNLDQYNLAKIVDV